LIIEKRNATVAAQQHRKKNELNFFQNFEDSNFMVNQKSAGDRWPQERVSVVKIEKKTKNSNENSATAKLNPLG
jgi:hypothetical protein